METAYLKSPEFWQSDECHVMVNDRDSGAVVQSEMLNRWCDGRAQLRGHLLFSTSGSTGNSKWVALSRRAIMTSAEAVNEHLQVTPHDHWLLALPTFHVGGMGVVAHQIPHAIAQQRRCHRHLGICRRARRSPAVSAPTL